MKLPLRQSSSINHRSAFQAFIGLLFAVIQTVAKDERPIEVDSPAKVKPGTTALLKSTGTHLPGPLPASGWRRKSEVPPRGAFSRPRPPTSWMLRRYLKRSP